MQSHVYSLFEFNQLVRSTLEAMYPDRYLITAEVASLKLDQKGHCYLDLVERDEHTVVAQMRATIWASQFRGISRRFSVATGMELSKGMKLLTEAGLSYHERYGLSLSIFDIDPAYTLGEMALKRREVLARLEKEGLLEKNRLLEMSIVPLNVAVISSPGAAGYEDFVHHLYENPYSYPFSITLLKTVMQGDSAEPSIIKALEKCEEHLQVFDVVVIIRGGGGNADLQCFDSYDIGKHIANLSIPVLAGIGHERDRTVVDEVAHTSVKTPTAAAVFLIETVRRFDLRLSELETGLLSAHRRLIHDHLSDLYRVSRDLERSITRFLVQEEGRMRSFEVSLGNSKKLISVMREKVGSLWRECFGVMKQRLREQEMGLAHSFTLLKTHVKTLLSGKAGNLKELGNIIKHLDPLSVMKRGFSITYKEGVLIKDIYDLAPGDIIKTVLPGGTANSSVTEVSSDGKKTSSDV